LGVVDLRTWSFGESETPNGTSDAQTLLGDYASPILKPRAAEIVKKHGEALEAGMAYLS
jgi:hypothetical protein